MTDWQPIETAPKDETEIDVWAIPPKGPGCRVTNVCWTRMTDWDGREFEGWTGMYPVRFGYRHEPTHWMPTPAPPKS